MISTVRCLVRPDTYRDSVQLMRVAAEVERLPGVTRAALLMGTPANRELLAEAGLLAGAAARARPNDLVVAVLARAHLSTSFPRKRESISGPWAPAFAGATSECGVSRMYQD